MSNLLVLGASADQIPTYLEARRLGCRTIGVDQRDDAPAVALADEFLPVSTREPEAVIERLGAVAVAGVVAPASDANQPALRALAEHYGTPFRPSVAALAKAVGFRYRADGYLADMDGDFYSADYLRAWIRTAQLRAHLRSTIGEDWWRRTETGELLRALFQEGTRPTSEEIADRIGYDPLDTAPLVEELVAA